MIQDLTLFTKHEYLPWQQLRYGPHVGDLHVVAETCSSPHLAESLFPPAEGAHSSSCVEYGPADGLVGILQASSAVQLIAPFGICW